eukprot:gb/GECG01000896.1/.p1 GENE.gb/GECG01000896.1/~~gb/GECG01000896.1/.p1  ORF type:complete len:256 (+),score=34.65 gb/GECG01000896.1/:1-768(+)
MNSSGHYSGSTSAGGAGSAEALRAALESTKLVSAHYTKKVLRDKVLVVGDAGVGKSTIIASVVSGGSDVPKQYNMTTQPQLRRKMIKAQTVTGGSDSTDAGGEASEQKREEEDEIRQRYPVHVEILFVDTPGASTFNQREFGTQHWHSFGDIALVYDVSSRESFKGCAKWFRRIQDTQPNRPLSGVLIANKKDLAEDDRRVISKEEGEKYAKAFKLAYFEISATTGEGVDVPFQHLAQRFNKRYQDHIEDILNVS